MDDENKDIKVLIIDDSADNLNVLGSILRIEGYRVAFATSGIRGIEIALAKIPDIILLDIMMPEMDGFTVCTELKKNTLTKEIPIIFLSAQRDIENIKKGRQAGGAYYIIKPFVPVELLTRIKTELNIQKQSELKYSQNRALSVSQVKMLEGELLNLWKVVKVGMFVDDILKFSEKVKKYAEKNQIESLVKYSHELSLSCGHFQVTKMQFEFNKFPGYVHMLVAKH